MVPGWQPLYGSVAMVLAVLLAFPLVEMLVKASATARPVANPG
jgi:hypothetical protein